MSLVMPKRVVVRLGARLFQSKRGADVAAGAERFFKLVQGKGGGGRTARSEARAVAPLLPQEGGVVFDLGAHRGKWTQALLECAGERVARLYAFEPSPANVRRLRDAFQRGPVEVVEAAVGSGGARATLYSGHSGSDMASLKIRTDVPQHMREQVDVVALDEFAAEHAIEAIHFLKMDVEGHEMAVLEGAERLLREERIRALSFEVSGWNIYTHTFLWDYWELLSGHGFAFYRIMPGAWLLPIPHYTKDLESFHGPTNYVALLKR